MVDAQKRISSEGLKAPRQFRRFHIALAWNVALRELYLARHNLAFDHIGPMVQAVLLATIITVSISARSEVAGFILPGLVIGLSIQRSFEITAFSIMDAKIRGEIQNLLMAPLSALEIASGLLFNALFNSVIVLGLIWMLLSLFQPMSTEQPLHALIWVLLGIIICSGLGILAGLFSKNWDSLFFKESFIFTPLLFLSGVFFSVDDLPDHWQEWLGWNPFYFIIHGFRSALYGVELNGVGVIVTLLLALLVTMRSIAAFEQGKGIKQ